LGSGLVRAVCKLARRACKLNAATIIASARTDTYDPVSVRHDIEIVFDLDRRAAELDKFAEERKEPAHVTAVKSRGRLVEGISGAGPASSRASLSRWRSPPEGIETASRARGASADQSEVA